MAANDNVDRSSDDRAVGRKNPHRSATYLGGSYVIGERGRAKEARLSTEANIENGRKIVAQIRARRLARGIPIDVTLG